MKMYIIKKCRDCCPYYHSGDPSYCKLTNTIFPVHELGKIYGDLPFISSICKLEEYVKS